MRELDVLASNRLDENFDASMAVVDSDVYLRGRNHLYCISENKTEPPPTARGAARLSLARGTR